MRRVLLALLLSVTSVEIANSYNIQNVGPLLRVQVSPAEKGEFIPFSALPAPFDKPAPVSQWRDDYFQYFYPYEDKQYWYGFFRVDQNGNGEFSHWFSNGKMVDGDTFCATAILTDGTGAAMHSFTARAGVNPGGSERAINFNLQKPLDWWQQAAGFTFKHWHCGKRDDSAIWGAVLEFVKAIVADDSRSSTKAE